MKERQTHATDLRIGWNLEIRSAKLERRLGTDLAGADRKASGCMDMGAYEFQPPAGTMFVVR